MTSTSSDVARSAVVHTAGGEVLRIGRPRLRRLCARFGRAVLAELLTGARAGAPVVHRRTGQRLLLLRARAGRRRFWVFARPTGGEADVIAVRELAPAAEHDGFWHREWQQQLEKQLAHQYGLALAATDDRGSQGVFRDNLGQLVDGQPVASSHPDVSYIGRSGRRVNVEIDTDPLNSAFDLRKLRNADDQAVAVSIAIDPRTGRATGTYVYDPVSNTTKHHRGQIVLPPPQAPATRPPPSRYGPPGGPVTYTFGPSPRGGRLISKAMLGRLALRSERARRQRRRAAAR